MELIPKLIRTRLINNKKEWLLKFMQKYAIAGHDIVYKLSYQSTHICEWNQKVRNTELITIESKHENWNPWDHELQTLHTLWISFRTCRIYKWNSPCKKHWQVKVLEIKISPPNSSEACQSSLLMALCLPLLMMLMNEPY